MFDDPSAPTSEEWRMVSFNDGANYFINEASVDELLTKFHSWRSIENIVPYEIEFLKTIVMGRFAQAQVKSMDRLTEALNRASKSSTIVGLGLIVVGIAAVVVAVYLK